MSEAVIIALIALISGGGAFTGRWIFKRLDDLAAEIRTLQGDNLALVEKRGEDQAEIAALRAKIETLEDARKERDALRSALQHRESLLDRCVPGWRLAAADDANAALLDHATTP